MNIPPHLSRPLKGTVEKEKFWLDECRKRVRGNQRIPGYQEPLKLRGSMKARPQFVRRRAGKYMVRISYKAIMSIYSRVSQIYTPCR